MSKKTNTLLFILGWTVFNIIITVLSFFIFLVIYSRFLNGLLPESSAAWAIPIIFVVSIVASFFVYRLIIKVIMKKVDMEKYFDPIFGRCRPSAKQ